MQIEWRKSRLKLKETFSISYGSYDFRDALLVSLSHLGKTGYGECVAINYYGINLDEFILKLDEIKPFIEKSAVVHPKEFYNHLLSLNLHPFLLSALDCAYWNLFGKLENKSFNEINLINVSVLPESFYTISIAEINEQVNKIERSGWNRYKVKCNGLDRENIFKLLETGKEIALDSNTSFSDEDCWFLQNDERSKQFLYVEQPRPIGEYKILNNKLNANWMADEDCQDITYLEKLKENYSSINVKLMKCGGITPALELISEAKRLNYKVMIGCMTESSVGISAGIAVAALCDFADLDGANLTSNDFAKGSFVENGKLLLSEKPGLGISLL